MFIYDRFTAVGVDRPSERNNFNQVLFVGLEDGRVLKLLMRATNLTAEERQLEQPVIVQEYRLFRAAVNSLLVAEGQLIAVSDEQVRSVELGSECGKAESCGECVGAQDPYCAWSLGRSACVKVASAEVGESLVAVTKVNNVQSCFNLTGKLTQRNEFNLVGRTGFGNRFFQTLSPFKWLDRICFKIEF